MNRTLLSLSFALFPLVLSPAFAQPPPPASTGAQSSPAAPTPADFDKQIAQMRENMQNMQAQMERIRQTQDPAERQKLLSEHWASMQSAMATMRQAWQSGGMGWCMGGPGPGGGMMGGPGMMGYGTTGPMMGWRNMSGYYGKLTAEQMKQRQYMMDQYLPMQQMMMDQMMWHSYWSNPPAPPAK